MSREDILARIPERWGKYCDVGDGWMPVVDELNVRLARLDPDYTIAQVKEKFGGLRFYPETIRADVREQAYAIIREAEDKCSTICEVCGAPGRLREVRWYKTKCDDCFISNRPITY